MKNVFYLFFVMFVVIFTACTKEETETIDKATPPNADFVSGDFTIKQPVWVLSDENYIDEYGYKGILYINLNNSNETWLISEYLPAELDLDNETKGIIRYGTLLFEYNEEGRVTKISCTGAISNCSATVGTDQDGVTHVQIRTLK